MAAKKEIAKTPQSKSTYTAEDIKTLPFPDNVRTRPEMYVGTTNKTGQLKCFGEILNNAVDEILAGYGEDIYVNRLGDYGFSITDCGRGVPHTIDTATKKNVMLTIFGSLHSGRNFVKKDFYSTGKNGVGSSCVNALSEKFLAVSKRDGKEVTIVFKKGKFDFINSVDNPKTLKNTGTVVEFTLDREIFDDEVISNEEIKRLLEVTAYTTSGSRIHFDDVRTSEKVTFSTDVGIKDILHKTMGVKGVIPTIEINDTVKEVVISVAFTYTDDYNGEEISSFVNTIPTTEGGTHVTGFKRALSATFIKFIEENKLSKEKIEGSDLLEGLKAVISIFAYEPKYSSQTKQKLDNNEINGYVYQAVNSHLRTWLEYHQKEIRELVKRFTLSAKGRLAKKKAIESVFGKKSETSTMLSSLNSISKFTDCIEDNNKVTSLFIVEG